MERSYSGDIQPLSITRNDTTYRLFLSPSLLKPVMFKNFNEEIQVTQFDFTLRIFPLPGKSSLVYQLGCVW